MRLLIQRVLQGQVICFENNKQQHRADIGHGVVVFVGFGANDTLLLPQSPIWKNMIDKLLGLRVFPDHDGKMNVSLLDYLKNPIKNTSLTEDKAPFAWDSETAEDGLLLVSQFTLYADCRKGRRPSFQGAAEPTIALQLYERLQDDLIAALGTRLKHGLFGADMRVSLTNWGPVTLLLDSFELYGQ